MAPLLDIRNVTISFPVRGASSITEAAAVRDISFSVGSGEVLGLVGESGSGKSVTSLAIMRLLPPTAKVRGSIVYERNEICGHGDLLGIVSDRK